MYNYNNYTGGRGRSNGRGNGRSNGRCNGRGNSRGNGQGPAVSGSGQGSFVGNGRPLRPPTMDSTSSSVELSSVGPSSVGPTIVEGTTTKTTTFPGTYLGPNGYTIPKHELTLPQLRKIRKDCTIIPAVVGVLRGPPPAGIELYRETKSCMYLPRYLGVQLYGPYEQNRLSPGKKMADGLTFSQSLRDDQPLVLEAFKATLVEEPSFHPDGTPRNETICVGGGVIQMRCGGGKTVVGICLALTRNTPTLIVVNKTFLKNQWMERIQDACPGARVGTIQADEFDIKDKDFAIVMLQTIYDKVYPPGTFDDFGLMLIDESHRMCSPQYFKFMQQITTPVVVGLSATFGGVETRGVADVLYSFAGKKFYIGQNPNVGDMVTVYGIHFKHTDEQYTNVPLNFKGETQYSTLVSQISEFPPRIAFVLRVILDMLNESPTDQIMALSFTRSLLTAIHTGITDSDNEYTSGFYVGGMKSEDLSATETKNVVLATYAMAAEALDIKTLNSLVMASPKVDIIQSVGRILRDLFCEKVIIDIIDVHPTFQKQWQKRRKYYETCGYKIFSTTSDEYRGIEHTFWKPYTSRKKPGPKDKDQNKKKGTTLTKEKEESDDDDDGVELPDCML